MMMGFLNFDCSQETDESWMNSLDPHILYITERVVTKCGWLRKGRLLVNFKNDDTSLCAEMMVSLNENIYIIYSFSLDISCQVKQFIKWNYYYVDGKMNIDKVKSNFKSTLLVSWRKFQETVDVKNFNSSEFLDEQEICWRSCEKERICYDEELFATNIVPNIFSWFWKEPTAWWSSF